MGWISPTEIVAWFDLNGIEAINRPWYYHSIMALESGYLGAKAELANSK